MFHLVGSERDARSPWTGGGIGAEHAIRGLHSVTMLVRASARTIELMTGILGWRVADEADRATRVSTGGDGPGHLIDVVQAPEVPVALNGIGTVHHVAMAIGSADEQRRLREELVTLGVSVTDIRDRQYFQSIYFREPGGVLFEVATVSPGFTVDEPLDQLGRSLKLPPWEEAERRGDRGGAAAGDVCVARSRSALALLVAPALHAQADSARSLGQAFQMAGKASAAGDWKSARAALEAALRFSPENPAVLYSLARAEARLGNRAGAVRALNRLTQQGVVRAIGGRQRLRVVSVVARVQGRRPPARERGGPDRPERHRIRAARPRLHTRGHRVGPGGRCVVRRARSPGGASCASRATASTVWVRTDSARLTQILGLRVDDRGAGSGSPRLPWTPPLPVSFAAPEDGLPSRHTSIPTGRRLGRWVPDSAGPHLLNDIAVTGGGVVYATDSEGSALYRLGSDEGPLERVHHDPDRFNYPNGIALSADGSRLYVAHWEGLSSFLLGAGGGLRPEARVGRSGVTTAGIDGLYRCGERASGGAVSARLLPDHAVDPEPRRAERGGGAGARAASPRAGGSDHGRAGAGRVLLYRQRAARPARGEISR